MGFLDSGTTFVWEEASMSPVDFVKKYGVVQFINLFETFKDRKRDCIKFGDEVEYILVTVDEQNKRTKLCLRSHELLEILNKEEKDTKGEVDHLWRPEYGSFMIEGTPGKPYGSTKELCHFLEIEKNMVARRKKVTELLKPNERVLTVTNFPLLGASHLGESFCEPAATPGGQFASSIFTPDEIINPHPRFGTLTANIRNRKGSKVAIHIPLFKDENTPTTLTVPTKSSASKQEKPQLFSDEETNRPGDIYMDSMAFGMGCCCLQATFQACTIREARYLYDQLAVMSPLLLALTAATPIFKGYLADTDVRWNTIVQSVDDRKPQERPETASQNSSKSEKTHLVIPKSRYDSIDSYLSEASKVRNYSDIPLVMDDDVLKTLLQNGIDEILARHIAHLFIRDPLVIYREKLTMDHKTHSDHFENIQSTNWQTVRFKPPPFGSEIGWRVEFRTMEIQMTDFENAAFVVFMALFNQAVIKGDLNLLIPISKVDENLKTAHKRNAILTEKFYFRKSATANVCCEDTAKEGDDYYGLMTLNEIINGSSEFPGLLSYIRQYLNGRQQCTPELREQIEVYLDFVSKRASGELISTATWIRNFVQKHPNYKKDSAIDHVLNHDLCSAMWEISNGKRAAPELYGKNVDIAKRL